MDSGELTLRERLQRAETALSRVILVGHNKDCIFCGFKDSQVSEYEQSLERRGDAAPAPAAGREEE
jgi:hypothetical protein